MSLAKRLSAVIPQSSNRTCGTCKWVAELPVEDRAAWQAWIAEDRSVSQLWEIAKSDDAHPYTMSLAAMRMCIRVHHREAAT